MTVRRIRGSEGALLKALRLAALRDSPSAFGSAVEVEAALGDGEWADRARRGAAGTERATFLACDAHRAVGLVGAHRRDPSARDVELVSMWTVPDARRRGAAAALVRAVLDWAGETGAEAVNLWVTRGNDAAKALYERLGFEETGEHQPLPSDPCKDEIRMVARLGSPA